MYPVSLDISTARTTEPSMGGIHKRIRHPHPLFLTRYVRLRNHAVRIVDPTEWCPPTIQTETDLGLKQSSSRPRETVMTGGGGGGGGGCAMRAVLPGSSGLDTATRMQRWPHRWKANSASGAQHNAGPAAGRATQLERLRVAVARKPDQEAVQSKHPWSRKGAQDQTRSRSGHGAQGNYVLAHKYTCTFSFSFHEPTTCTLDVITALRARDSQLKVHATAEKT